jgi:hypothetical protein
MLLCTVLEGPSGYVHQEDDDCEHRNAGDAGPQRTKFRWFTNHQGLRPGRGRIGIRGPVHGQHQHHHLSSRIMIKIHLMPGMDPRFAPIPAPLHKAWWQDNDKTRNHAHHCLPLSLANSLGYCILSPVTFKWSWDGDIQKDAVIEIIEAVGPCTVDAHAAYGSFHHSARFYSHN